MADVDIEPGCYRLAIADYCTNTCGQYFIYNPYFNGNPLCLDCLPIGWTSTPVTGSNNWNVGNGEATIDLTAIGNATNLVSVTELCEDTDYYVEIEVESIINARLRLQVDGNNYGTAITTAGTYNFTITVTDSGPLSLFGSQFGASLDGEIVVKRVTVRADKNCSYHRWRLLRQLQVLQDRRLQCGESIRPCIQWHIVLARHPLGGPQIPRSVQLGC
jgi:hypothetical protein